MLLDRPPRLLYGVCWIGGPGAGASGNAGGDGGDGGDGGVGAATGGNAAGPGGTSTSVGFGQAGAATGVGNVGNPAGAPAGTSTTGTGSFGFGDGGDAAAAAPSATGTSVGIGPGTATSGTGGGTAATGGGVGGTTTGGGATTGGGGFGGGIGGGAPTGGNAGGNAPGGIGAALGQLAAQLFGSPAAAKTTLRAGPLGMGPPTRGQTISTLGTPAGQSTNPADTQALGSAANIGVPSLGTLANQTATLGLPSLTDLLSGVFGNTAVTGGLNFGPGTFGGTAVVGGSPAPGGITVGGLNGPGFHFGGPGGNQGVAGAPATVGPGSHAAPPGVPAAVTTIAHDLIAHHPDMPFSTALAIATHMAGSSTSEGEVASSPAPFGDDSENSVTGPLGLPGVPNSADTLNAPGTVPDNSLMRAATSPQIGLGI